MKRSMGSILFVCFDFVLTATLCQHALCQQLTLQKDSPAAVVTRFQRAIKERNYQEAWDVLAPKLQKEAGNFAAFERALKKSNVSRKIAAFRIERSKIKGNRAVIITDCVEPALQSFELIKLTGRWRIANLGTQTKPVYPDGQELEFAKAARQYAGLSVEWYRVKGLLEQADRLLAYHASSTRERNHPLSEDNRHRENIADALEAAQTQLGEYRSIYASAHKQRDMKPYIKELDGLHETLSGLLSSLKAKAAALLVRANPDFSLEEAGSHHRDASMSVPKSQFGKRLFFGPVVRWWRYESWDAFAPLGFDFVCIDTGWGSARAGKTVAGEHDFSRIDELVAESAARGYQSDIGQAGLGALGFNIWDPAQQERWQSSTLR